MALNIHLPTATVMKPKITVFGVGGAGGNATNNMINKGLEGATFIIANTDAQALEISVADKRIQLGQRTTQGLGAGADPEIGRLSAEETLEEIQSYLHGSNMVFITAGMGGGTGTGASAVIAKVAKDMGILTVGVVTKPFHFEGPRRMRVAEQGINELQKNVDTLIVIPNQNLFRIANEKTTFAEAFAMADEVLHAGVRGVTDLMVMPGLINLDFADIRTVMSEKGKAMMGIGEAEGDKRAQEAANAAISNPLLDNVSMKGAKGVLINITGGSDMTLFEVDEAANRVREEVDPSANVIFGSTFNEDMKGKMRVSVVATGIDSEENTADTLGGMSRHVEKKPVPQYKPRTGWTASAPTVSGASVSNTIKNIENDIDKAIQNNVTAKPEYKSVIESINKEYQEKQQSDIGGIENKSRPQNLHNPLPHTNTTSAANREYYKMPPLVTPDSYSAGHDMFSRTNLNANPNNNQNLAYGDRENIKNTNASSNIGHKDNFKTAMELGIFSRMARGVAKSFGAVDKKDESKPWPTSNLESTDKKELEFAEVSSSSKENKVMQEDLLDIPAFLRRNNND